VGVVGVVGRQLSWRIGESIKDGPAYWMEVRRIWWDCRRGRRNRNRNFAAGNIKIFNNISEK
jgi:hypothetical protein